MNIQLNAAEENDNGTVTKLGQLLIRYVCPKGRAHSASRLAYATDRCNNVLWIKAADGATNGDTEMAE